MHLRRCSRSEAQFLLISGWICLLLSLLLLLFLCFVIIIIIIIIIMIIIVIIFSSDWFVAVEGLGLEGTAQDTHPAFWQLMVSEAFRRASQ